MFTTKKTAKIIVLYITVVYLFSLLLAACSTPLGCQSTAEISGYVPHSMHFKAPKTHLRKTY